MLAQWDGEENIIIICGSETPAGVSEPLFHVSRPWGIIRFLRKKSAKTFESPFYSILIVRYCVHRGSPGNKTDTQEGNTMKDFELRYVGSHVEVYTGSGVFLFSADTVREAMEELAG